MAAPLFRPSPRNRSWSIERVWVPGGRGDPLASDAPQVAGHVSVEHDPDKQWAVDFLDFLESVRIGDFNLDAEVLLLVDEESAQRNGTSPPTKARRE